MVGTAGLPHILTRYYTTPSVRQARMSVAWSLFFIFLLYFTAPAYAAFARFTIYAKLVGTKLSELPRWVTLWQPAGLFSVVDKNGDGIVQWADFVVRSTDFVVLSMPEIAGLPFVITGLVMAGGLAAALSTADGLLLTIANAISHDLYYNVIDHTASLTKRLTITKALLIITALVAAYVATFRIAIIVELVAWAFSLAGASFFPALVMGIWWKRANSRRGCRDVGGFTRHGVLHDRQPLLRRVVVRDADHRVGDLRPTSRLPHHLDRLTADGAAAAGGPGPRRQCPIPEVGAGDQG
jgi:cation/acetate symporter